MSEIKTNPGTKKFDLIVVYLERNAKSASGNSSTPFFGKRSGYNDSYSYFLKKCKKLGIKACLSTSKDIIGPGLLQSYWTYSGQWEKHLDKAYSKFIFSKFTPDNAGQKKRKKLLRSNEKIYVPNRKIEKLFRDKQLTHEIFEDYSIPTIKIDDLSKKSIYEAKNKLDKILDKHMNKDDFNEEYIIKDQHGAGGMGILKVNLKEGDLSAVEKQQKQDIASGIEAKYILQPFIDCEKGFVFGKHSGLIDLRVILINHKIKQTYIRIAKKGEFKCNEHQGGNLVYKDKNILPVDVIKATKEISKKIASISSSAIYALDFIRSNEGNLYFIEGNSKPGIDWNPDKKINEVKSKELISMIVNQLDGIIEQRKTLIKVVA